MLLISIRIKSLYFLKSTVQIATWTSSSQPKITVIIIVGPHFGKIDISCPLFFMVIFFSLHLVHPSTFSTKLLPMSYFLEFHQSVKFSPIPPHSLTDFLIPNIKFRQFGSKCSPQVPHSRCILILTLTFILPLPGHLRLCQLLLTWATPPVSAGAHLGQSACVSCTPAREENMSNSARGCSSSSSRLSSRLLNSLACCSLCRTFGLLWFGQCRGNAFDCAVSLIFPSWYYLISLLSASGIA